MCTTNEIQMIWLTSPHAHCQTDTPMQMINKSKLFLVLLKPLMCLSETIQRMRSCNAASETGMPRLEKSAKKPAPPSLRSLGQLCLQSSSRHRQVPTRSGYWKKQSVQSGWSLLKLPPMEVTKPVVCSDGKLAFSH